MIPFESFRGVLANQIQREELSSMRSCRSPERRERLSPRRKASSLWRMGALFFQGMAKSVFPTRFFIDSIPEARRKAAFPPRYREWISFQKIQIGTFSITVWSI
jgi:hypothetical protein